MNKMKFWVVGIYLASVSLVSFAELGLPPHVNKLLDTDQMVVLEVPLKGDTLRIAASPKFGGSIVSMTFRGKQYVNDDDGKVVDYGRQIQSAVSYDEMGECFNPTEAGGRYDVGHDHSSSRLLASNIAGRTLETTTDMAFWMRPGERHTLNGCGGTWVGNTAQNRAITSGYLLRKKITAGQNQNDNVIRYEATFESPIQRQSARFEPLSVHLPSDFNNVLVWDGKTWAANDSKAFRSQEPVILTTADGKNAVGIYMKFPSGTNSWYGLKIWPNVAVIRCLIKKEKLNSRTESFTGYMVVGNQDEVKAGMNKLVASQTAH